MMKFGINYKLSVGVVLGLWVWVMSLHAVILLEEDSTGWGMLSPMDGSSNGLTPAIADPDYYSTWHSQSLGSYVGVAYDGPAFTTGHQAPFEYGGVDGITENTVIPKPNNGTRGTAYFLKVIDGGASGYTEFTVDMLADDAAYVYLNGVLIGVKGSISTDPNDDRWDEYASATGSESDFSEITLIGTPQVQPGLNILAVSVHQRSTTSSDLGFRMNMIEQVGGVDGVTILAEDSSGWAMLSPLDANSNGMAPDLNDFYSTWHSQSFGTYTGVAYSGPVFTTGHQAPFEYGGVDGITENTVIPKPNSGTRGAAYFLKVIDGGVNGYPSFSFAANMLADDAAYVYLNGELIGVKGDVPANASSDTWDRYADSTGSETAYTLLNLFGNPELLPGPNLLAVSVHQYSTTSSDLGFALYLDDTLSMVREPYLQASSDTAITVRWRTNILSDSVVMYGDAPNNLTESATLSAQVRDHEVKLTGLSPATKYFYKVQSSNTSDSVMAGGDTTYYFQTHPSPGDATPTRVWVIGDSGTKPSHSAYTSKVAVYDAYLALTGASTHTDAWLMLGDNAYNSGTDAEFQAAVFDPYPELLRNTVMWSCLGNHEAYTSGGAPYLDIHTFPTAGESGGIASGTERYYSFDYGNIHFISIDSETDSNVDDILGGTMGMADWLELDLQATDKDWIVAFFHHGPYTMGSHNSDTESHHIRVRRYITPLLERYGVDLVLSGHSHAYERSMLVNGHHSNFSTADSTSSTFVTGTHVIDGGNGSDVGSVDGAGAYSNSGGDGAYEKPLAAGESGAVYVICGASGKLSNWDDGTSAVVNPTPHPVFVVNLRVMGSMILEVDGNELNAKYIDGTGAVRDDFTILKGSTVSLSATDSTFAEYGADDTATIQFNRTGATSLAEDVSYQISGSASNGTDYSTLSGTVPFAAGETSKDVILTRQADDDAEGVEDAQLTLLPATQAAGASGAQRDRYFIASPSSDSVTLADAPSQQWWYDAFGTATLADVDWELDTDQDGLNRLLEYAFGGTEGANDYDRLPQMMTSPGVLELHYWKDNSLTDLSYTVEAFTDLQTKAPTSFSNVLEGAANPVGEERWKATVPVDAEPKKFMQISVQN